MSLSHSFPRSRRLRGGDFARIYRQRCSASDRKLTVYAAAGRGRLGLSVSRKCGSAVLRNRIKRLIREAYRLNRAALPQDVDLVVVCHRGATLTLPDAASSLKQLTGRARRRLMSSS